MDLYEVVSIECIDKFIPCGKISVMNNNRSINTQSGKKARGKHGRETRFRFPALIVAIVSAFFVFLFFVMATMDLRRIEHVLVGMLEKQGAHQVDRLGEAAFFNFRQLVDGNQGLFGSDFVLSANGNGLSVQEYLVAELVDLARDIEYLEDSPGFSEERLAMLEQSEKITNILFFDRAGHLLYGKSSDFKNLSSISQKLLTGHHTVSIKLFEDGRLLKNSGYVGIRRPNGNGALIMHLDSENLRFHAWKAALTRAVGSFQWGQDVIYFGIYADRGESIIETRDNPVTPKNFPVTDALNADGGLPNYASVIHEESLAIASFLEIPGAPRSMVILGFSMAEEAGILHESRRHIILSTGLMATIGLLAMAVLYIMQDRHIRKVRQMSSQLNKANRLSSLGKLGAGMAHEIRNPLNAISMAAQRLAKEHPVVGEKKAGYDRITEVIALETIRLNSLVDDFLTLSSSGKLRLKRHSTKAVVSRVLFLLKPEAAGKKIKIDILNDGGERDLLIDPDRLEQALLNIIHNAIDAIGMDGMIGISLADKKGHTIIRITDTGPGIRQEDLDNIFDPSFTTRVKGVGLGLAIAHEIISAHEGRIRVESEEGKGTTFEIVLPV